MTKLEMLKAVAEKAETTQKVVDEVLASYVDVVVETLKSDKDEKITLPNIGTFRVKHVAEKHGVATLGEKKEWTKPAHDEITFKISKSVKELD